MQGSARFQPRLRALVLSLLLPLLFLTLVLSRRLADIAAIALRRRDPRGKLVRERGQVVTLTGSGFWLRTAGVVVVLCIRPCPGSRSTIGLWL